MKHLIASLLMLWALMAPLLGRGLDGSGTGCGERLSRPSCCAQAVRACPAACCQKAPERLPDPVAPPTVPPSASLSDLAALPFLAVLWTLPEWSRSQPAAPSGPDPAAALEAAVPLFRRDCALLI